MEMPSTLIGLAHKVFTEAQFTLEHRQGQVAVTQPHKPTRSNRSNLRHSSLTNEIEWLDHQT